MRITYTACSARKLEIIAYRRGVQRRLLTSGPPPEKCLLSGELGMRVATMTTNTERYKACVQR